MKKIKVLFIPNLMPSHLIPLIALAKTMDKSYFEINFLVPVPFREYIISNNLDYIDIDRKKIDKLTPELKAISIFKPNVIVDDFNYYTAFSSRLTKTKRVSIVRKGIFPFESASPGLRHSSEVVTYFNTLKTVDFSGLGLWQPKTVSDLFSGDINIIPSIPSIETLPDQLVGDNSYVYSGPLVLGDTEMLGSLTYSKELIANLNYFFGINRNRRIIYFTIGLANPPEILKKAESCIRAVLSNNNYALITNISDPKFCDVGDSSRYFSSPFLPMNYVCSKVDLMVHQCGSGVYNYQLIYQVPGIVLGSNCYDRDDIAIQLEKLGATGFISAKLNEDMFYKRFADFTRQLLDMSSTFYSEQKASLARLKKEIISIKNKFNFNDVIMQIAEKNKF